VKIFLQEIAFHPELQEHYKHIFSQHVYAKFRDIIVCFQDKGEVIEAPPNSVIRFTITTIAGFLFHPYLQY
jgi:hypothetical protein